VFELRLRGEPFSIFYRRAAQFLKAGVEAVYLLDEVSGRVGVYYPDKPPQLLQPEDELNLPDETGRRNRIPVRSFFE
jgi:hypothetical protein